VKVEVAVDTEDKASHIVLGMFHLVQEKYSFPRHDHDCVSNYKLSRDFEEMRMSIFLNFVPQVMTSHDTGFIDML